MFQAEEDDIETDGAKMVNGITERHSSIPEESYADSLAAVGKYKLLFTKNKC